MDMYIHPIRTCISITRRTWTLRLASRLGRHPLPRRSAWALLWTTSTNWEWTTYALDEKSITQSVNIYGCVVGCVVGQIAEYEKDVSSYLYSRLGDIPDLRLYGPDPIAQGHSRAALVAFNHDNIHASDLSTFLDQEGIAVRAGHHCTQPLHRLLGAAGSIRASLYVYNTRQEVDCFIDALHRVIQMFSDISEAPGIDLGFAALGMEGLSLLTAGEMGPNDEEEGGVME